MHRRIGVACLSALVALASGCAFGVGANDGHLDAGKKTGAAPKDGGTTTADAGKNTPDADAGPVATCDLTMCGGQCVDTTSDDANCGVCFNACPSGSSCMGGICQAQQTTTNAPPQGVCAHDLCSSSGSLTSGCDPSGCTTEVCNSDPYCCESTGAWDGTCVSEVATYCAPYSCP